MDENIPLHKDRGLDPHSTYCPRCGGESNEITIGEIKEITLPDGHKVFANRGKVAKTCKNYGFMPSNCTVKEVDEYKKLPASQPCDMCKKELITFDTEIKKGGVYFKCKNCATTGVLKGHTEYAKKVRKLIGIKPPKPTGIEFDKCEQHKVG